ncbi:hypothetical protein STINGER_59 [Mycobacterium phage Stinger]|uniref:Uncharacterized protein n=1 Tax=Mycobacterium phage Stinger TaxID=1089137 RepID=G8I9I0_9CAUD|nr:hypothetical protein STINGER_59 [Mycobacterium phage Stinger]AER49374.1 hypothetical protein STINGER_59 [Mycobacterium phage Stinger]
MPTSNADRAVCFGAGLFIGLAVGMPLGLAIAAPKDAEQVRSTPASVAEQCEEDMPCWDCTTMGNRLCGPGMAPPMDFGLPVYAVTVAAR